MIKNLFKDYIYPVTVFSSGMIGVGFLSLPYIASKVGILPMFAYIIIISAIIVAVNLIFCQISLKTPDFKRFPGFAGHYLGRWAKIFTLIITIVAAFGVLLAYLVVAEQFFKTAFQPISSERVLFFVLTYFLLASVVIYFDIKVIKRVEFWILCLLFFSLLFIFIEGFFHIKISNIFVSDFGFRASDLFLPYGPLLFALWGISLIPETEEMLRGRKNNLKKVVAISTIIIAVFYLLFTVLVLGITGIKASPMGLDGLKNFLGDGAVFVALIAGIMVTFTAFISQGIILKKTLTFDLKIGHWHAFVVTCFTPMIFFLLGLKSFIPILSLIGGILLGIDGILILLIYKKIGGKNIIIFPLSLIFLAGVIYEIIYFVK